jgi:cyclopropane fatty-acyl-phospholipid synthase-like methyltransferase
LVENRTTAAFWDQVAYETLVGRERYAWDAGVVWCSDGFRTFGLEMLALEDGQRVLEVGCGHGIALKEISKRHPNVHLTGLDFSAGQLRLAETILSADVAVLVQADLNVGLPQHLGSFDLVLSVFGALDFIRVVPRGLEDCLDLLLPGGRFVAITSKMDDLVRAARQLTNATVLLQEHLSGGRGVLKLGYA